jgi:hypothetical protein
MQPGTWQTVAYALMLAAALAVLTAIILMRPAERMAQSAAISITHAPP